MERKNFRKWNTNSKLTEQRSISQPRIWTPPRKGVLKVNIDGLFEEGASDAAIACICRDYTGRIVDGFVKSAKAASAVHAES